MKCPICNLEYMGTSYPLCEHGAFDLIRENKRLKEENKHLKHTNTTLRKSNAGLKAIVKRLKQYEPKQTFYDDGSNYKII